VGKNKFRLGKTETIVYISFTALAGIWISLSFLFPFLKYFGWNSITDGIWNLLGNICHQKPERSFYILGWQMGLCVRCISIYSAIFVSALSYPVIRKVFKRLPIWLLVLSPLPILVGVFLKFDSSAIRIVTGSIAGIIIPYFIISGITQFILIVKNLIKKGTLCKKESKF